MSDHNGVPRRTEFDAVAELRAEVDEMLGGYERRLGIAEAVLTDRIDGLAHKIDKLTAEASRTFGEFKTLSEHIVKVLDLAMATEKRVTALETAKRPRRAKKVK